MAYKDTDQLAWLIKHGSLTEREGEWIRAQGRRAAEALQRREFPYDADWSLWAPEPDWPAPFLPPDWATSPLSGSLPG